MKKNKITTKKNNEEMPFYLSLREFSKKYVDWSEASLRWLIYENKNNFNDIVLRRVGRRKILISIKDFWEWIENRKRIHKITNIKKVIEKNVNQVKNIQEKKNKISDEFSDMIGGLHFYSVRQIVNLGIFGSLVSVRRSMYAGELPYIKVTPRRSIVKREDLIEFIKSKL